MSPSATESNVAQPPRDFTPLWMLDIDFYAVLGVHPRSSQQEIGETYQHWEALEASKPFFGHDLEDTVAAHFQVRQAYAVLRNPMSRHKYDVKVITQLSVLGAFETTMTENVARLTNDLKVVENYHLGRLKWQSVTEGISRDKFSQIKGRISSSSLSQDMPIAVHAAALARYPLATSSPAWSDYTHWWLSRDEARRARRHTEQAWKAVQVRRDRLEKAVGESNAVAEKLACLRRE